MKRTRYVDLNSVLIGANLLVAAAIALVWPQAAGNPYLDHTTLVLGLVLCAQTHLALWIERRQRDPFVLLLAIDMIVYYALRMVTLTLYPFSTVFDRFPYSPPDSNRALVFILIANLFLYAGFYLAKFNGNEAVTPGGRRARSPGRTVLLLLVAVVIGYSSIHYGVSEDEASNLASLLSFFLEPRTVVMMALTYCLIFRSSLGRTFIASITILIVIEMAMHTLAGSRSALVGFIESCLIVLLAVSGGVRIAARYLVAGVLLSPLIALMLVASFAISTYNRAHREIGDNASFDLGQAVESASVSAGSLDLGPSLDLVLPPLFARVGFFDFSAEIIAHRAEYADVLNPGAYGRSIVDNLLTPGFDVYDQPRTANALQFIYRDFGTPSKEQAAEYYQSDQLGIYGELYGLFAYGSLPLFFLVAWLLKLTFVRLTSPNPFTFAMKRVLVLFVFVDLLHSYGLDWVIIEAVPLAVAILVYGYFFASRRVTTPGAAATAATGRS